MNSAAVCPNNRCSSERSSRTKTSAAAAFVGEELTASGRRLSRHRVASSSQSLSRVVDSPAAEKYKPDDVPTISELFDLRGRVAIVTGGSRGLGQEMAEGLAEAGASLMLCARRQEWLTPTVDEMRARGFRVEGALCDVAKAADVQARCRRHHRGVRQGGHPGQQRRDHLGGGTRSDAARQVAARRGRQPDGRLPVLAGGGARHAAHAAGDGSSTSPRSPACTRWSTVRTTRPYAATKAGLMGLTQGTGGIVGTAGHPRQRDRTRLLPFAPGRRRHRR